MYTRPTRATPDGCVIALFGAGALIYAALSAWALYLALSVPAPRRDMTLVWRLIVGLVVAVAIGAALIWIGWRLARRADMADPNDPRKPMIRF